MERVFNTPFKAAIEAKLHDEDGQAECAEDHQPPLRQFIDAQFAKLSPAARQTYIALAEHSVDFWPLIVPMYSKKFDSFYPGKQQGKEFAKWLNVSQKFWDVSLANVTVLPITGKVFADASTLLPAVQWILKVNTTAAQIIVDVVQEAIAKYPAMGYNFPMWSLNAAAVRRNAVSWPATFVNLPAVLMGDGMTMFLRSMRRAEAGIDFVMFHELGHHLQIGMNISELYDRGPDATRYMELLSDAYSAYFAHHPRGASFQTNRILQAAEVAYSIGDCDVSEIGHHGTPNQRHRAVLFATQLVDKSKQGRKLKAAEFKSQFDAAYGAIIKPDQIK
jgi:hypothetical protein